MYLRGRGGTQSADPHLSYSWNLYRGNTTKNYFLLAERKEKRVQFTYLTDKRKDFVRKHFFS